MTKALFSRYRIAPLRRRVATRSRHAWGWFHGVSRLVRREWYSKTRPTIRQRLRAGRWGFTSDTYIMYDLDHNDPRLYHTDYAGFAKDEWIDGHYGSIVNTKHLFAVMLERFGVRQPRLHGLIRNGKLMSVLDMKSLRGKRGKVFVKLLRTEQRLVLKPSFGGCGQGIIFLRQSANDVEINGVAATDADARELISHLHDFMVLDHVIQAEYAAKIYPDTTNTMRVLTLWDYDVRVPFVAAAAHRFGTSRSYPVDNWHAGNGGLSSGVNVETGEVGPGATLSPEGRPVWHEKHPETNEPVKGVMVPFWTETKDMLIRLAARLPVVPVVGWDLMITKKGPSLLEGNAPPGVFVWQVHAPLYRDERARRFFAAHNAL